MTEQNNETITRLQELAYKLTIGQAMTSDVITVSPDATMAELREILRSNGISGTPVVEKGRLVGIASIEDLIEAMAAGELDAAVRRRMTTDLVTVSADEPLVNAVALFGRHRFGRLPVIGPQGGLVGIITKGDIPQAMLQRLQVDLREEEVRRYRASHIFEDIIADDAALVFGYRVVGGDFDRAGESASGLRRTLGRLGLRPQLIRRAAVATIEAEMNIMVFTNGGEIVVEVRPDRIKIEAVDKGPGIPDIEQAMQPGFSTAPEWVRRLGFGAGMGLPNIQACADKMILDSEVGKGTHLEVIISSHQDRRM